MKEIGPSIEEIVADIHRIRRAMGNMTHALNEAFGGVHADAQNQNQALFALGRQSELLQTRVNELGNEVSRINTQDIESLKEVPAGQK